MRLRSTVCSLIIHELDLVIEMEVQQKRSSRFMARIDTFTRYHYKIIFMSKRFSLTLRGYILHSVDYNGTHSANYRPKHLKTGQFSSIRSEVV